MAGRGDAGAGVVDVVIVGGGAAGLNAAHALRARKLSVVVLEARDRVGGRTWTEPWAVPGVKGGSVVVDSGGQWVGPSQKTVNALLKRYGLALREQYHAGTHVLEVNNRVLEHKGTISQLKEFAPGELERVWTQLDSMAAAVDVAAPWTACGAAELDGMSVHRWVTLNVSDPITAWMVEWFATVCIAADTDQISFLYFLGWLKSGGFYKSLVDTDGGAQNHTVVGGMQQLAQHMVAELGPATVQLSCPVSHIEQRDGRVTVHHARGAVVARRCIVALSPPLCTRDKLRFTPDVPSHRHYLTQRMVSGQVIKVMVAFRRPFWREDSGLSGEIISDKGPLAVAYDRSEPDVGLWCIVGFCAGSSAKAWGALTAEARRAQTLEQLGRCYRNPALARDLCVAYRDHNWSTEEFSGGCYFSYAPPKVLTTFGEALREPHGLVHWSGTETADEWIGYIEGALQAGARVGGEVADALAGPRAKL